MVITAKSTEIFRRVLEPENGTLPADPARFVEKLDFSPKDHAQFEELSAKARAGTLSSEEGDLLDSFLHIDSLLGIMRLKATHSLVA